MTVLQAEVQPVKGYGGHHVEVAAQPALWQFQQIGLHGPTWAHPCHPDHWIATTTQGTRNPPPFTPSLSQEREFSEADAMTSHSLSSIKVKRPLRLRRTEDDMSSRQ